MKSVKYLEMVRTKFNLKTDVALAAKIGITKSAVGNYSKGIRVMDEETCLAVAMALEVNPLDVMMAAGIDRAEKTGQKSLWEVFSQRTAQAAGIAIFGIVTLLVTPTPAEATQTLKNSNLSVYIM
ncbi:MAG: helix-turn-helix transcriptional regulator [Glaciimonas sp.]|nr:helix-turn-helix transcriptional regulator [Glaciimonas sp.]